MHTPNLDTLTVKYTHRWSENMYRFQKIGSSATHLDNLHTVHIDNLLCMDQTAHLFLLPSLRSMTITNLVPKDDYNMYQKRAADILPRLILEPGISSVETLTLQRADMEPQTLTHFTNACKRLENLSYTYSFDSTGSSADLSFHLQYRASVLRTHRAELERLCLCQSYHGMQYRSHAIQVARLASELPNLHALDVGLLMHGDAQGDCTSDIIARFVGLLPPSLEELTLEIDWKEFWGAKGWVGPTEVLRCLAEVAPARLSRLKKVAVVEWPESLDFFPPLFEDVVA